MAKDSTKMFPKKRGMPGPKRILAVIALLTIIIVAVSLAYPIIWVMMLLIGSLMVFFLPVVILLAFIFIPPILGISDKIRTTRSITRAPSSAQKTEHL